MNTSIASSLKIASFCIAVLFLCSSFTLKDETKIRSANWQILHSTSEIEICYRYEECKLPASGLNNENVYLKITNRTANTLKVEWATEYWYNNKCNGCEEGSQENNKSIILNPMEAKEGKCSENCESELKIFSKMLGKGTRSELTNFNLKNIKIYPIN